MNTEDKCLFCDIANKIISAEIIYETKNVIAFHDINPEAPLHCLIIPKMHIATINELDTKNSFVVAHLYEAAAEIAGKYNVAKEGYRVVMNCNKDAGQTVFHLHLHLLAGRQLSWPPG